MLAERQCGGRAFCEVGDLVWWRTRGLADEKAGGASCMMLKSGLRV